MADEEPGLLGNLPRSRPGTRSGKRDSTGSQPAPDRKQAAKPGGGGRAPAGKAAGSRKAAGSQRSKAPAKPGPTPEKAARNAPSRPPTPSGKGKSVPVGVAGDTPQRSTSRGPLHQAAKVAGTGLRVAEGVTREVLRRLPRP